MKWFYDLKIRTKLIAGFSIVALITTFVGIVGYISLNNAGNYLLNIGNNRLPSISALKTITEAQNSVIVGERGLINNHMMDPEIRKAQYDFIDSAFKRAEEALQIYEGLEHSNEENVLWNKFQSEWEKWRKADAEVINLSREKDKLINTGVALNDPKIIEHDEVVFQSSLISRQYFLESDKTIKQIIEINENAAKEIVVNSGNEVKVSTLVLIATIAVGVILALGSGLFISGSISRPIVKMVEAADKIALGDINVNVQADTKDELGTLMNSFSNMIASIREQALAVEKIASGDLTVQVRIKSDNDLLSKKLSEMIDINNEILGSINASSDQVASGAKQVSASSMALSQGSTEQASSIEEITASITQIAAQTKQNAHNANQANELALSAKDKAVQGNNQMKEMLKSMQDINDSSANISKIIKVIDEIAFQTNILALNAAVEAARAGQHGKGFAVVAEEVRNLAARSANAAKETTDLIEGSIKKVEIGSKIANETASALNEIVEGVAKAANLVGDIAVASSEQATGISQVNQAIGQVAQVVQTNSATAEECAAASEELSSQADVLKNMVSRFKLRKTKGVFNSISGINPDVLKMLENMAEKKNHANSGETAYHSEAAPMSEIKIALDDKDFGKY